MSRQGVSVDRKNCTLTSTEKRFVLAATQPGCPPFGWDVNNPADREDIRRIMRGTAYHEAGHFAARCFTGLEMGHVVKISIIPDETSIGRITSERNFTRLSLQFDYDNSSQAKELASHRRSQGIMLMLHDLAGYGANIISDTSGEWDNIWAYWADNYFEDDEDGTDMSMAYHTAEIIKTPYMPPSRILRLADRWTLEMLRIPAIWDIVETVSDGLLQHGELTADDLEDIMYDSMVPRIYTNPKWRRRVFGVSRKGTARIQ